MGSSRQGSGSKPGTSRGRKPPPGKILHHRRPPWWPHQTREAWWKAELAKLGISESEVIAVVNRCAERKLAMFACFKEFEKADLVQVAMAGVYQGWSRFDARKSNWRTFVYRIAFCDIRDLYRSRSRQARVEGVVALDDPDGQGKGRAAISKWEDETQRLEDAEDDGVALEVLDSQNGEAMTDWLLRVYIAFKGFFKGQMKVRRGRKWFSPAQSAAAAMLMVRSALTTREAEALFKSRQDLCRIIELHHAPSHFWWVGTGKFLPKKFQDFEALKARWLLRKAREAANKQAL